MEKGQQIRQHWLQHARWEFAHRLQDALPHVFFFPQVTQPQRSCLVVADPDQGRDGAGAHGPFGVIPRHVAEGVQRALATGLAQQLANPHAHPQVRVREGLNERLDDAGPGNLQQESKRWPTGFSGIFRQTLDEPADVAIALECGRGLCACPLVVLVQGLEKEGDRLVTHLLHSGQGAGSYLVRQFAQGLFQRFQGAHIADFAQGARRFFPHRWSGIPQQSVGEGVSGLASFQPSEGARGFGPDFLAAILQRGDQGNGGSGIGRGPEDPSGPIPLANRLGASQHIEQDRHRVRQKSLEHIGDRTADGRIVPPQRLDQRFDGSEIADS